MDVRKEVEKYFYKGGLSCSESTLQILIDAGVADCAPETVKMMTGFAGGMQCGLTCGAVTGAVAAIGSRLGRTEPVSREECVEMVKDFLAEWVDRFGDITCQGLKENYIPEHMAPDQDRHDVCEVLVQAAVEMVCARLGSEK